MKVLHSLHRQLSVGLGPPTSAMYLQPNPTVHPRKVEMRLVNQVCEPAGDQGYGPCSESTLARNKLVRNFIAAAGFRQVQDAELEAEGFTPDLIRKMHEDGYILNKGGMSYQADRRRPGGAMGYAWGKLATELIPIDTLDVNPDAYLEMCLAISPDVLEREFVTNPKKRLEDAERQLNELQHANSEIELEQRAQARRLWFFEKVAYEALRAQKKILMKLRQ